MYGGRVLEEIAARDLNNATHPYTRALLDSLPPLDRKVAALSVPERDPSWLEEPAA
jgi:peptide/nickel transport system ATP-binding protein